MADTQSSFQDDAGLAARLRGLPLHKPASDLWNEIALTLPRASTVKARWRWRPFAVVALAASLLVAALLPWSVRDPSMPASSQAPALSAQASADLGWLLARSSQLEQWLVDLPTAPSGNGRNLMATVEVEDLIALVDLQLDASRNASEALPLWRQRVALLESLSVLRSAPYGIADALDPPMASPADLNRL